MSFIIGLIIGVLLTLAFTHRNALAVRFYNDLAARAGKRANAAMAKSDAHEKEHQLELQRKYLAKAAEAAERAKPSPKPIS